MTTVASSAGVELAVHDLGGPADGQPLLLCHATGFHGRVWRAVAEELPGRRCLALDFRGFGDSTAPAGLDFDWHGFADDVLAVVDHFGLTEVQAVGHSKGGAALLLAELARPGTFERLVCFEPIVMPITGEGPPPGGNPMAAAARRRRDTFESHDDAIARFATKPTLGALRRDVLEDYVRHGFEPTAEGQVTLKARKEHEARTYEAGHRHGAFDRLGEVRCPVLVCHGGDGGMPAAVAPLVAQSLPAGTLLPFPELGHFGPLEEPARFAAAVREFLTGSP